MFSATLSKEIRPVCRKFMQDVSVYFKAVLFVVVVFTGTLLTHTALYFLQPMEVFVDDETKLTLHGLQQYYCKLKDSEKNRKLFDLLDVLEFNQVRDGGSGSGRLEPVIVEL